MRRRSCMGVDFRGPADPADFDHGPFVPHPYSADALRCVTCGSSVDRPDDWEEEVEGGEDEEEGYEPGA